MADIKLYAAWHIFSNVSNIDLVIGLFLIIGLAKGFLKGFIKELAGLVAIILGIYGAVRFSYFTIDLIKDYIDTTPEKMAILAYILTFLFIIVLVFIISSLLTRLVKFMAMGLLNRLLGGIFGLLKWSVILSFLLVFFVSINKDWELMEQKDLEDSKLYLPLMELGEKILPSTVELIQNYHTEIKSDETVSLY